MALHDSPLADASSRALTLRILCAAAALPASARELASQSGDPLPGLRVQDRLGL